VTVTEVQEQSLLGLRFRVDGSLIYLTNADAGIEKVTQDLRRI